MNVLVTGGTGRVGKETVRQLMEKGFDVRVIGRSKDNTPQQAEYRVCDVTNHEALVEQVRGMDAIIHLAAIPHPSGGPSQEIFRVNCTGTFNVYQAAAQVGIKRVVTASSINAFGFNFGIKGFPIRYLPIDEQHPTCTTDPYSFSKQITEEIADYYWRREGISGVCLRLPAVIDTSSDETKWRAGIRKETQALLDELQETPAQGQAHLARVHELLETVRSERRYERPRDSSQKRSADMNIIHGWTDFWTGLDTRDSAQAFVQGVCADYQGSHALFVNDSQNVVGIPSRDLARVFYPEVNTYKTPLGDETALISIDRARDLIGFEPQYHLADLPAQAR